MVRVRSEQHAKRGALAGRQISERGAPSQRPPGGLPHGTPGTGLARSAAVGRGAAPGVPRGRALPGRGDGARTPCVGAEHSRSGAGERRRHPTARSGTNAQLRRHGATRERQRWPSASGFGTTRSQVQVLSPRPRERPSQELLAKARQAVLLFVARLSAQGRYYGRGRICSTREPTGPSTSASSSEPTTAERKHVARVAVGWSGPTVG